MTDPDTVDDIRQEHCALLWALSVLADDVRYQTPVYRALAGCKPPAWIGLLMRVAELVGDTIPRYGADDFPPGVFNTDVPPVLLTRAAAAAQLREQLSALVTRHGELLDAADDDLDRLPLDHLDDGLRQLLDPGDAAGDQR